MKGAVFAGHGQVSIREFPMPVCPPGGLLARVDACAICGSDLRMYDYGPTDEQVIHGHECVMSIAETGAGVTGFAPGDRVMLCPVTCGYCDYCIRGLNHLCTNKSAVRTVVQGGYAQYRPIGPEAIAGGFIVPVPDDLSDVEATVVEPLSCVLQGSEKLDIYPGKTVVIIGAGPIGNLHTQVANLRGAARTILMDLLACRLEMSRPVRPTHVINASITDPVEAVLNLTGGIGAEVVVVACVSATAQAQALRMAARGGQVCFFAALPPGRSQVNLDTNLIHNRELAVIGSRGSTRRHFDLAVELLRSRRIDASPLITHILPLEQIGEGFGLVKTGQAMKVVIRP